MENGDLRAVVRYFLPPHSPNCTYHMRLHADRRDPPLPPALHVSTLHLLGDNPGCGARNEDRWPRQACTSAPFPLVRCPLMLKTEILPSPMLCYESHSHEAYICCFSCCGQWHLISIALFNLSYSQHGNRLYGEHTEVPLASKAAR